jgi:6-phosphogluconolactonase
LFQVLSDSPRFGAFPWSDTHVWVVDDRAVPPEDPANNSTMIAESLVRRVKLAPERFHPMDAWVTAADERYERGLRSELTDAGRLDVVLLGVGTDGHTASLFPYTPALGESERWVVFNDGEAVVAPRPRLTMTYRLINASRHVAVLITGVGKREVVQQLCAASATLEGACVAQTASASAAGEFAAGAPVDAEQAVHSRLPVLGVRPLADGDITWYLDAAAVGV